MNLQSDCLVQDNYEGIAEALITMGATRRNVDKGKFGAELREVLEKITSMQPQVVITANQISGMSGRTHDLLCGFLNFVSTLR